MHHDSQNMIRLEAKTLEKAANYFIDISKLIFGGVTLAAIMDVKSVNTALLIIVGSVGALVYAVIGLVLYDNVSKRENK